MTSSRTDNRILSNESFTFKAELFPAHIVRQSKAQRSLRMGTGGGGGLVAVSVDGDYYFPELRPQQERH